MKNGFRTDINIEKEIIELCKQNIPRIEIAKKYSVCKATIMRILIRNNIKIRKYNRTSEEIEKFLIENYPSMGGVFCSKKLNKSIHCIHQLAKRLNLERNNHIVNNFKICPSCKENKNINEYNKEISFCIKCNRIKTNLYLKQRLKTDIQFKMRHNLRARISVVLKRNQKSDSTMKLIGCSIQDFKKYIESKFTQDMSWDNYGKFGWHIDHIIPCNSFDLSDPEQQRKCFHHTNLQPLWSTTEVARQHGDFNTIGNTNKGNKIIH